MLTIYRTLRSYLDFYRDTRGLTTVEYAVAGALIALAVVAAFALLGLIWANLQGVEDWGTLDFQDWVTIVVPAVLVFGATYFVSNPTTYTPKHKA